MNLIPPTEANIAERKPAIVVTGASSGIGREIARLAAPDGYPMVLVAKDGLDTIASELRSRGSDVTEICIDLQAGDAAETITRTLAANGLYCEILVNSAGFGLFGAAAELESEQQMKLIDVNVRAVAALSLAFLPGMIARRRGGILNIGSVTGVLPGPFMAVYFASKAFVHSFSAALAAEAAPAGVTVTCLIPGVVRTAFFENLSVADTRFMKIMPRTNAVRVATAGWRGLKSGRHVVVPRLSDRFVLMVAAMLPIRVFTWMLARVWR